MNIYSKTFVWISGIMSPWNIFDKTKEEGCIPPPCGGSGIREPRSFLKINIIKLTKTFFCILKPCVLSCAWVLFLMWYVCVNNSDSNKYILVIKDCKLKVLYLHFIVMFCIAQEHGFGWINNLTISKLARPSHSVY